MNAFTTEYTERIEFYRVLILLLDSICHSERSEESTLSCQYSLMSILIPVLGEQILRSALNDRMFCLINKMFCLIKRERLCESLCPLW